MFASIKKRWAIKSYVRRLGKDLAQRYGRAKTYTPEQIVRTVHDKGYNALHIGYAHALYSSRKAFDRWHGERGETCDYAAMRAEIGGSSLAGNTGAMDVSDFGTETESSHGGSDLGSD